ncbi:TetR/AcrR family transcriptional regulator [Fodinicola acaciae]|uniref:TetR/AcrR family transcriptional regulator n=1 Tax=Fodinicola acaciae TaxID=2681555 RepID=UPI0013D30EC6|nr:TetR/AcrR family transcriptional regulator [Fodinicola acaciae]
MDRRVERGQATRDQLVEIATRLFAEHGYDGTSIDAVLQESGVSRGALYHHFSGKDALFEAVYLKTMRDAGRRTMQATRAESEPLASLRAGCLAWIEQVADPVVRRIVLVDAPSVIGWQRWREYDDKMTLGVMKAWTAQAAADGLLPAGQSDLFAHVLLASINEIALVTARAEDERDAIEVATAALDEFLQRLFSRR